MLFQNLGADKARRVLDEVAQEEPGTPQRGIGKSGPAWLRQGVLAAAVSGIGVVALVTASVASSPSGIAFAGQPSDVAVDIQRDTSLSRDVLRAPLSAEELASQREQSIAKASEQVAEGLEQAGLEARQSNLADAAKAVSTEAERLRNLADFLWPTAGTIGSPYGMRRHPILHYYRMHDGNDIGGACGQPIFAAQSGKVTKAESEGYHGGSGNNVRIDHGDIVGHNVQTAYLHMSKIIVAVGDYVQKGQQIGNVGNTGLSTSCHLHLSLYEDGHGINSSTYVHQPARTDAAAVEAAAAGKAIPPKKSGASEPVNGTDEVNDTDDLAAVRRATLG